MKKYYPAFLDVSKKNILIIGGGTIALRKILSLLKCGAKISVVAIKFHSRILALQDQKKIVIVKGEFKKEQLNHRDLVFCATDNHELNQTVAQACFEKEVWVNVVDNPSLCSFIVPSTVNRGEVVFAISTGGASPALSKYLRKKIELYFGKELGTLSQILKKYRAQLLEISLQKRRKVLEELLNDKVFVDLKKGKIKQIEQKLGGNNGNF